MMTDAQKANAVIQAFTGAMADLIDNQSAVELARNARAEINTMRDCDIAVLYDRFVRKMAG